jgi:hypothetical protein
MMTPQEAYSCNGPIKRTWETYYKNRKEVDNMKAQNETVPSLVHLGMTMNKGI